MKTLNTALVATVALVQIAAAQSKPPIRTGGAGYDGVIIERGSQSAEGNSRTALARWTPAEHDVREAERLLSAYLASSEAASRLRDTRIRSELRRYKRQYWGEMNGSRRLIRMLFYHEDTSVVQNGTWLRTAVSVSGGGDRFFQVMYEVDRSRFTNLWVNTPE